MKNYDYDLLVQLYSIHSPSHGEKKMRKFIKRWCRRNGIEVVQDSAGNVLATKGVSDTYPCIAAHIDQVQHNHSKDFHVYMQDDIIFAYSAKSKQQQGLGADDKNGVWVALQMLRDFDVAKAAFFVGEEVGCIGSSAVDMSFFKDCRFVIQADRRNGNDLITDISGKICSDEFLNDINASSFGYVETSGLMTDVETLCDRGVGVACINFSCGYYHPHTDEECTSWSELCNACDFAEFIFANCTKVYAHEYENKWDKYYGTNNYYGTYGYGGLGKSSKKSKWDKYYDDNFDWWDDDWEKHHNTGKTETKKAESTIDDWDEWDEENDRDWMNYIVSNEPHLSFEEVLQDYQSVFKTQDYDKLYDMYLDAWEQTRSTYFETPKSGVA